MGNKNAFLFIGDSFTWGQGLYFYSNLSGQIKPEDGKYFDENVNEIHRKYKDSKRFARIVANHFDSFEVVKNTNGGSDLESIEFIENFLKKYDLNDIGCLIFQSTYFARSPFDFTFEGVDYSVDVHGYPEYKQGKDIEIFISWCKENQLTFEDYVELHKRQIFKKIRDIFVFFDKNKINAKFICWTNDYYSLIKEDAFMGGRFIKIDYKDKEYNSFFDLMFFNKELCIKTDPFFDNNPKDGHLSLKAHEIVAKSIIKELEKN